MNYVKLHTDALNAYKRLSDTEFGRAVRAILQYAEDGTEPNLPGKESIMFDVLREQVERDRVSYEKKLAAQRANGSKGGRPPKPNVTQGNPWVSNKPNGTQKSQEKEKEKENTSSIGSSEAEEEAILRDAAAHRRVVDAAVDAGFPDNVKTLDRITALIADYSAEWVETAIERCVDQSNSSLQYLCAVLDNFKRHGSPEAAAEAHRRKKQPDNDDPLAEPPWGWNQ